MSLDIKGGDPKKKTSLRDTRMMLPREVQDLLPEDMMANHYEPSNELHCGKGEGGSKFSDPRIHDIFDVIKRRPDLAEKVRQRIDDRDALQAAGAPASAFLPATNAPKGIPEALYFKVDDVHGRLGVIQLNKLPSEARVLVRREKGRGDPEAKRYVPCSFTVVQGQGEDLPTTNFATIIVGRKKGGNDAVWTIHPGAPARSILKDISGTEKLLSPEEAGEQPQNVKVMTVQELLGSKSFDPNDYIKLIPGDLDTLIEEKGYQVV